MEMRQLRYFIAAAERGSFRKAAVVLKVNESAVSRSIRDFEDRIGVSLFIRSSAGVILTDAGEELLHHARKVISQVDHATLTVGRMGRGEEGTVRIGIFSPLASSFLAELLHSYRRQHSGVRLEFTEGGASEQITAVNQGRIDIAFIPEVSSCGNCDLLHLWREQVYVALPARHNLVDLPELHWSHLQDHTFIVRASGPGPDVHDYIVRKLSGTGARPIVERHDVSRETLLRLVAIGQGVTLVAARPADEASQGIVFRPLASELLTFSAVWLLQNDNPACRRLISLARRFRPAQNAA